MEGAADGSHFLLQIRDFDPSRRTIFPETMVRVSPIGSASMQSIQPGEVIFLAKGAKNFAWAVNDTLPRPCLAASSFLVLRPEPVIQPSFLAWYLNQPETQKTIAQLATTGANMPIITASQLRSLEISVPDRATQAKIVALDALAHQHHALLLELAEKTRKLVSTACMKSMRTPNSFHPSEMNP